VITAHVELYDCLARTASLPAVAAGELLESRLGGHTYAGMARSLALCASGLLAFRTSQCVAVICGTQECAASCRAEDSLLSWHCKLLSRSIVFDLDVWREVFLDGLECELLITTSNWERCVLLD
jgi:hypothetical protein